MVSDVSGFEPVLRITVLDVIGSRVKLGFEAAKEVTIHRAEVWARLRIETEASEPSPDVSLPRYLDPYLD